MTKRWPGLLLLAAWLGGSGVAHAALTANPTSIDLSPPSVPVGSTATGSTLLSANPSVTVTLELAATGCGEFTITPPTTLMVGSGGNAKTMTVSLTPTSAGPKSCTVSIKQGTTVLTTVDVTATATAAVLTLMPTLPLPAFPNTEVGATSATQTLTASNTGDAPLVISSAALTASSVDFVVQSGSPGPITIQPGGTPVNWTIACRPQSFGIKSGTFQILSNSSTGTTTNVDLSCTGTQGVLTAIPTSHNFGGVVVGTSVVFPFQIKNDGNAPITMLSGGLADTTKGYVFDPATVTPTTLNPGATKDLSVAFTPTSGSSGGMVNLNFQGRWGTSSTLTTATLQLNGDGQIASFTATPSPLAFGNFRFDTQPQLPYQIKNTGEVNLSIDAVTFTPDMGTTASEVTFPTVTPQMLTPNQQIDIAVTLKPNNRAGAIGGKFTVHSATAGTTDQQLTVTGNATAATFTATDKIEFGNVDVTSASPMKTITIRNTSGTTLDINSITLSANPNPAFTFTNLPTSKILLAPTEERNISVTYHPTTVHPMGENDEVTVTATFGGVINSPLAVPIPVTGHGIDSSLVVQSAPLFPMTFRNPGSNAPVRMITVRNNGEAVLKITDVTVTGGPVWQLVDAGPVDIAGGSAHEFKVRFSPTDLGAAPTGQLTVVQSNPGRPNATVTLNGQCIERKIAFGPAAAAGQMPTIEFPFTRASGTTMIADALAVANMEMSVDFTIQKITIDDNPAFTLLDDPRAVALPVGAMQVYGIKFEPKTLDHFETVVHLYADQDPVPQAEVKLVGDSVFAEGRGGGGCNAGGAGGGGFVAGLLTLGLLRRRRRAAATLAAATLAVATLAPAARADDIGITVFQPTPTTTGTGFAVQGPEVGPHGSLVMNALTSYATDSLVFASIKRDGSQAGEDALVASTMLWQLGAAYALLDRFELGARLPIYQQSGDTGPSGTPASGTAYGDLTLHGKARLVSLGLGLGSLVAGVGAAVVVPTATKDQHISSGNVEARLFALASFTPAGLRERLRLSANLGSVLRPTSEYNGVIERNAIAWGGSASYRVSDNVWLTGELFGYVTPQGLRKFQSGEMTPAAVTLSQIEGLAGVTVKPVRWFAIGAALGRGVTSAAGTPGFRGVLSLSIVPGAASSPPIYRPEPPDGDADGDGVRDSVDKCPNEPEDKDMFEDDDGCPDPDNDHDGIPDDKDRCPLDPEDKDGFQDDDGCPDKDNDADGIPDAMDKCPNDPEDKDGFEDLDGCPEPDNDRDGVPDDKDKCPNEPETINGIQDDDGCPDKGDSTIILSPDKIETLDPIQFTGLKLAKASLPLLAQVGATLRAHTEIVRLRITVHVQPTSNAEADQARSDNRAKAIREWLINWGIAPTRLEARGFGGIKPLVPPDARGAAKINDRLELIILERK